MKIVFNSTKKIICEINICNFSREININLGAQTPDQTNPKWLAIYINWRKLRERNFLEWSWILVAAFYVCGPQHSNTFLFILSLHFCLHTLAAFTCKAFIYTFFDRDTCFLWDSSWCHGY